MPLVVKNGNNVSNFTSIAVAPQGGTCSDPFGYTSNELNTANATGKLNVGSVSLTKTNLKVSAAGISLDTATDIGAASFVSYDASQLVASRGNGGTAVTVGSCTLFTVAGTSGTPTDPIQPRVLDAGNVINVTGPNGAKQLTKVQGGLYSATLAQTTGVGGLPGGLPGLPGGIPGLPGGGGSGSSYLTAGAYGTNNGAGGVDVGSFTSNLTIPGNFAWSNEASTTQVTRTSDLDITWTGAGANDYVFVTGTSFDQNARVGAAFYCLERGSASRLTVSSSILLGMPPSSVISGAQTGFLAVGVTGEPSRFTARGVDVGIFTYQSLTGKTLGYR